MPLIRCPYCGFQKDLPDTGMPQGARATCPKCKHQFPLRRSDGRSQNVGVPPQPQSGSIAQPSAPEESAASTSQPPPSLNQTGAGGLVAITCPACNFSSNVPREKIPPRTVNLTCRKCQNRFKFSGDQLDQPPKKQDAPPPPPKPVHPLLQDRTGPEESPKRSTLRKIPELLGDSWQIFKERILVLIGINLLGMLLIGVGAFILSSGFGNLTELFGENMITGLLVALLALTFSSLAVTWLSGATICAITDDALGVRVALGAGLKLLLPFLWVFSLLGLIIFGASLVFFIPGLLLATLFMFAQFIVATEESRGMEALLKSREYVKGFFWPVLGRVLVLAILMGFICGILGLIPFIGPLISLILWPYTLIVYHEIYSDLRNIKSDMIFTCQRNDKVKWLAIGCAGYLVIPIIVVLMISTGAINNSLTGQFQTGSSNVPSAPTQFNPQPAVNEPAPTMSDSMVYIYAVNYTGTVLLNDETIYTIEGEQDVNYNTTQEISLKPGPNELVVTYRQVPTASFFSLKLKIFRIDWDSGEEISLKEVDIADESGTKKFSVNY